MLFLRANSKDVPWSRIFGVMQADVLLLILAFTRLPGRPLHSHVLLVPLYLQVQLRLIILCFSMYIIWTGLDWARYFDFEFGFDFDIDYSCNYFFDNTIDIEIEEWNEINC